MSQVKRNQNRSKGYKNPRHLAISLIIVGIVVVSIFAKFTVNPLDINLISSDFNNTSITLEGVIIKETPTYLPGQYYLALLSGDLIFLQTDTNLDLVEGKRVVVTGTLFPEQTNTGFQQLNLEEVTIK